jgi:hypothetical protein
MPKRELAEPASLLPSQAADTKLPCLLDVSTEVEAHRAERQEKRKGRGA